MSAAAFSMFIPGLLATCSTDNTVKIFDLHSMGASSSATEGGMAGIVTPKNILTKQMNVGPLFSLDFFADSPFLLAAAGEDGAVAIWDGHEDVHLNRCFGASRRLETPPSIS